MPNTKTNWKKKAEELEQELTAVREETQRIVEAAQVLAKDKEQVERELSAKRTENAALSVQLEKIVQAIQGQQAAVAEEPDEDQGDLAEVIPIRPSDGNE